MKNILYLGPADDYINRLKGELKKYILDCELIIEQEVSIYNSYHQIEQLKPQIVLLNYSSMEALKREFSTMIQKVFGKIPFIILVPNKEYAVKVENLASIGDYIYCVKNVSIEDVIFYISKQLNLRSSLVINQKKASYTDWFKMYFCIRVAYLGKTYARVETNRYFSNDSTLQVKLPYHVKLFSSDRHKIRERSTTEIRSQFTYRYNLEYMLHNRKMELLERSNLLKDFQYELKTKPVNESKYLAIIEATKERKISLVEGDEEEGQSTSDEDNKMIKQIDVTSRAIYFNWLFEQNSGKISFRDTITIYDREDYFLKKPIDIENHSMSIIYRKNIFNYKEDIPTDLPSIIVVNHDKEYNIERIKDMISSVTLLKDHFPFIIIFNYDELPVHDLRQLVEYHFLICLPTPPESEVLIRMLEIYRRKKTERDTQKSHKKLYKIREDDPSFLEHDENLLFDYKVYKKIEDPASLIIDHFEAEVLSISEYSMTFRTATHIEIGEVFRLTNPFDLQLVIMDKVNTSNSSSLVFVGHFFFVSETDKMAIKSFVQEVSGLDKPKEISPEKLQEMKDKYFPFNHVYKL